TTRRGLRGVIMPAAARPPVRTGEPMTGTDLQVATEDAYVLAEGPFWDGPRDRLLWVDIEQGLVVVGTLEADGRITVVEQVTFPGRVGAVAPSAAGDWIVAVDTGLVVRDR